MTAAARTAEGTFLSPDMLKQESIAIFVVTGAVCGCPSEPVAIDSTRSIEELVEMYQVRSRRITIIFSVPDSLEARRW
jgi:hypothetical protein